jgi:hypothetical protein
MMNTQERLIIQAISLCFKKHLRPQEAMVYVSLQRTQFNAKILEYNIQKTKAGYYKKSDLDRMMAGELLTLHERAASLIIPGAKSTASSQAQEGD